MTRALALLLAAAVATAAPAAAQDPGDGPWRQYADPTEAGFSKAGLDSVFQQAEAARSGAVLAVHRGRVLFAFGDVARELDLYSVRKSLTSALYGIAVERDLVDLDATLADLAIDDLQGLTAEERSARVVDLIAARSGVYHPSAYSPADMDAGLPGRGSAPPGTRFYYNNWDFNVAQAIVADAAGEELFELFDDWIAEPLGMEDYDPGDGFAALEPTVSRWPALAFRVSARDLARFGWLYANGGRWSGERILPEGWVEESFVPRSDAGDGAGYGYMWWIYPAGSLPERYVHTNPHDVFLARGSGGQALFVVPSAELVLVHRADSDHGRDVGGRDIWWMLEKTLAAREGDPVADPATMPLTPRPLASQLPTPQPPTFLDLPADEFAVYVGSYEFGPGVVARVFIHDGRLFMNMPSEGEAELFATAPDMFTVRVEAGVEIEFVRDEAGAVTGIRGRIGPRAMAAERVGDE